METSDDRLGLWERLSVALLGGMTIPVILSLTLLVAAQSLSPTWEPYLEALGWLIAWPELLLPRATPADVGNVILTLLLGNFIAYSLLTYALLHLYERGRKLKLP